MQDVRSSLCRFYRASSFPVLRTDNRLDGQAAGVLEDKAAGGSVWRHGKGHCPKLNEFHVGGVEG